MRIAIQSLDFWLCMHETITTNIANLPAYEHLFSQFREVCHIMLLNSQKIMRIKYSQLDAEEI